MWTQRYWKPASTTPKKVLTHLVEALTLQTAASHSEVDKGDPGAQVWGEVGLESRRNICSNMTTMNEVLHEIWSSLTAKQLRRWDYCMEALIFTCSAVYKREKNFVMYSQSEKPKTPLKQEADILTPFEASAMNSKC